MRPPSLGCWSPPKRWWAISPGKPPGRRQPRRAEAWAEWISEPKTTQLRLIAAMALSLASVTAREIDLRHRCHVAAEPRLQHRLACAEVARLVALDPHGDVMARHHDRARLLAPHPPDRGDGGAADRGVVGHVGIAGDQLRAIFRGVAGEDHVVLVAGDAEDQAARRVPGAEMGGDARKDVITIVHPDRRRPGQERIGIELGDRRLAPRLFHRPGDLGLADHDAGVAEQRPVHRMIVVRMREEHIRDIGRAHAALRKPVDQQLAHAEIPGVDHRGAAVAAQQRNGAPAEAAMAHRFAGKALDQDVDGVAADVHVRDPAKS